MLPFVGGVMPYVGLCKRNTSLFYIYIKRPIYICINIYIKRPIYIYINIQVVYIYLSCVKKTYILPFVGGVVSCLTQGCERGTRLSFIYTYRDIDIYLNIYIKRPIYIYRHIGRLHIFIICKKDLHIAICWGGRALLGAVKEEYVTFSYIHKETYIYISIYT